MNAHGEFVIQPIGRVKSSLKNKAEAPHQDNEGAPSAWIEIGDSYSEGIQDIRVDQEILVFTWFHLSDRDVLKVHPKNDPKQPIKGVFSTRSPARPNPIGLHRVRVLEVVSGKNLRVDHLDALDGTPVIDIKPVLK